ncbi:hypothetical protein ARMSODRAFT_964028 [Armillaria solidipes]|uniref:Uncharacterized protein n=1 Tax=Armillaria solidipes TaxID=1076256 RepID=A0A2H3B657_9AGAR|nr:hypothetical protein ARMSODRAFT_964028 [Armillaria solidipes]
MTTTTQSPEIQQFATPREKEIRIDPDVDLASSSLLDLVSSNLLKGLCPLQMKFLYYPQVIITI